MEENSPRLFRVGSRDCDEFARKMAPVAPSIDVRVHGLGAFSSRVTAARLRRCGIFDVCMSAARVLSSEGRGYTGLTIPIRGLFSIRRGGSSADFHAGTAHLLNDDEPFDLSVDRSSEMLVINFDQELLAYHHTRLFDNELEEISFSTDLSLLTPEGSGLYRHLHLAWSDIKRGVSWVDCDHIVVQWESLLATLLLFALERGSENGESDPGTRAVARAIDYIHGNLTDAISLADIAAESGVSARSLQRAFRRVLGRSPLQYLRDCRLDAARRDLVSADPAALSVTEVALRYSFNHLSRFAETYRAEFGERPSETLRRART